MGHLSGNAAEPRANVRGAFRRGASFMKLRVTAHNNDAIRDAVEAGVRCVEHGTGLDATVRDRVTGARDRMTEAQGCPAGSDYVEMPVPAGAQ